MKLPVRISRALLLLFVSAVTAIFAVRSAQAQACASGPCVSTYHNDPLRDGVMSQETALTPSLFPATGSANFGLLTPAAGGATGVVDGIIYAEPLYLSGVNMASAACSGSQNIILVATLNNSLYAFTWTYTLTPSSYSFSLTQCWTLNLNQPGEYAMPFTVAGLTKGGIPCNAVIPEIGITSTPVIDTSAHPPVMYVVSAHQTATLGYTYRLHAINVSTGTEILNGASAPYDLSGVFHGTATAKQELQRAGLAMFNPGNGTANVYVTFGSFCDQAPYSGYVAGLNYNYSTQAFAPVSPTNWVFDTESGATKQDGGIWMGGAAPAVDRAGNLYVAVSNGNWNGTTEFGESVVQLATTSAGLIPTDYYTPNDYLDLNKALSQVTICSAYGVNTCPSTNLLTIPTAGNFDLGSGGVTLLSPQGTMPSVCGSNGQLVAGGKEGVLYGICYSTQTTAPQNIMGGLDGCGYNCTSYSNPAISACTESPTPGNGSIAQCFQGVNAGENQSNGSNTLIDSAGMRGNEAFWGGSAANPENYLYISGGLSPMIAYQADPLTGMFDLPGSPSSVPKTFPYPGPIPSISWNGSDPTTALLWTIDTGGYGLWNPSKQAAQGAKPEILVVYNAIPSGNPAKLQELWESSKGKGNAAPGAVKFGVPTIAGGLVFIGGGTIGYAPGPPGGTGVNCTAAALVNSTTPNVCGGLLSIYGKLHN